MEKDLSSYELFQLKKYGNILPQFIGIVPEETHEEWNDNQDYNLPTTSNQ